MTTTDEPTTTKNLDGYDAPPIEWDRVRAALDQDITQAPGTGGPDRHTFWLATIDAAGTPHVVGIGAEWIDGRIYFTSGPGTRKSRNLARDPRCSINIATHDFDIALEGEAARVTDEATLQRVVARYNAGGWPATVSDGAFTAPFSAPSAGPPPWYLYEMTVHTAYALGTAEPGGATRWRFTA